MRNAIPNHGNCLGGASLRTQGAQRSKRFIAVLRTQMTKLEYLFPAPHPHFQRESLQTQISKLATFHIAKTHISELEICVSPKPKYQS